MMSAKEQKTFDYFLACPVRGVTKKVNRFLSDLISVLESMDSKVYWPPRDTNQNDTVGLNICYENEDGIKRSKDYWIFYNRSSMGSIFDTGAAFANEKEIHAINPYDLKYSPDTFEGFLFEYVHGKEHQSGFYKKMSEKLEEIKKGAMIIYEYKPDDIESVFILGMIFGLGKPIALKNREYLEGRRVPGRKSLENVAIALDDIYRTKLP